MSGTGQTQYEPVFTALGAATLATAVATWGAPQTGALADTVAEYTIRRVVGGVKRVYFVYFMRDANGIWRIDSM